jgi:DNA ligase-1
LIFSSKDGDLQKRRSEGATGRKGANGSEIKFNDAAGDAIEKAIDINAETTTSPLVEKNGSDAYSGSDSPESDNNRIASKNLKRENGPVEDESAESDDQPVTKRRKRSARDEKGSAVPTTKRRLVGAKAEDNSRKRSTKTRQEPEPVKQEESSTSDVDQERSENDEELEERPEVSMKKTEKIQATLRTSGRDPYPDWKQGDPVPYAALCTTFSLIEMTTKRLIILSHCSLFLRQVLRLTPADLLPTVQLMINKVAADYAGIELGIGESLIMKAIGESTGRSLAVIKADQHEIGDLGLVAAKSRSNQPTMFKPKPLTVRGVHEGLLHIAEVQGHGSQEKKISGIKKLLSAADAATAGKGSKAVDITHNKGGPSEAKFLIRFLEGKLRLGLAEKTVLVALAQAMVAHEVGLKSNKIASTEQLAKGEAILKTVYR